MSDPSVPAPRRGRLARLRGHQWSPPQRAALIAVVATVMGSLFLVTYTLALGDPVPHRIDAGLVGDPARHVRAVEAVEGVARDSLRFHRYGSTRDALHAIDEQQVYAALDLTATRPTLYVASAAGASVARVLEQIAVADPTVRVVDTHPLDPGDPNGLDIFYLMLVTTIIGFLSVLQVRANAPGLEQRHAIIFVAALALGASLALTIVDGVLLRRVHVPVPETWGILALHLVAVASFASLMAEALGRWALVPVWLFFVVLGNSSSGGAVAPPLLPPPFAFISRWLPSGATVEAVRNATYFPAHQHVHPIAVLGAWAIMLLVAWQLVARRRAATLARA